MAKRTFSATDRHSGATGPASAENAGRRRWRVSQSAAPRGPVNPSRLVAFMKLMLPAMVLVIVALLFAWPDLLSYGTRVGKTDFVTQRLSGLVLENPRYVGTDPDGRPYEVSAVRASKDAEDATLLYLDQPQADLMDLEGDSTWMRVTAGSGTYDTAMKLMQLHGGVTILDWAQRSLELETASVDLNAGTLTSTRPVTATGPNARIDGQGLRITDRGARIAFTGRSRAVFVP